MGKVILKQGKVMKCSLWFGVLVGILFIFSYIVSIELNQWFNPLVRDQLIETVEQYQTFEMNTVEQMIANFFHAQHLKGKIQLTALEENKTYNKSYRATFVYTEPLNEKLLSVSGEVTISGDYHSLESFTHFHAKDEHGNFQNINVRLKEYMPAHEVEQSGLFQTVKQVAWQQSSAQQKLDRAQTAFEQLLQERFASITVAGIFSTELSQSYYDEVSKNAHSLDKQIFRGFYYIDMDWAMESSDAMIEIQAEWELPTSGRIRDKQRYKEELLFAVQMMDYSSVDNGIYKLTLVEKRNSEKQVIAQETYYLAVKYGQLAQFRAANGAHLEKMTFHIEQEPLKREIQEQLVRHFISSYQFIESISVVVAKRMDDINDNVYRAILKVNDQFFIEYEYEPASPNHFEKGTVLEPHAVYTLQFNAIDSNSSEMQARFDQVKIDYWE